MRKRKKTEINGEGMEKGEERREERKRKGEKKKEGNETSIIAQTSNKHLQRSNCFIFLKNILLSMRYVYCSRRDR